jgi:hypothetical protein
MWKRILLYCFSAIVLYESAKAFWILYKDKQEIKTLNPMEDRVDIQILEQEISAKQTRGIFFGIIGLLVLLEGLNKDLSKNKEATQVAQ